MKDSVVKIKKYSSIVLMIIGGLAILYVIIGTSLTGLFLSSSKMIGAGGYLAGAPTERFETTNLSSYNYPTADLGAIPAITSPAPTQEGILTKRKVVKNGSLSLLVKKAEDTAKLIQDIAEEFGGFVQDSQIYEVSADVKSGTVSIRVPADKFTEAIEKIKRLAVKVERENINAQDVTEQFVDLEAQLKNFRAEEEQYLEIMKRAYTVDETLRVAQQLSAVRGNIERLEGQLQYLSRQVDMSNITVGLTTEADIEVFGIRWRPLFTIKQSFRSLLAGLTDYIDTLTAFVIRLPVYILWIVTTLVIVWIIWRIILWLRKKFFSPAA